MLDRFSMKFDVQDDGCWIWSAGKDRDGYGRFWVAERKNNVCAHRFAYQQAVGDLPDEMELDHLCRNPSCVNPDHLEVVTTVENLQRGVGTNGYTACKAGHEYVDGSFTWRYNAKGVYRSCRECERRYARDYQRRLRAQRREANGDAGSVVSE